jgi:hypothetical protein
MIRVYLKMRVKQLYRELSGVGLIRVLFLLALGVLACLFLVRAAQSVQNAIYLTLGIFTGLASLHFKRNDLKFMIINFKNYKHIILAEYLVFLIPVFALLVYNHQPLPIVILLFLTTLLTTLNWRPKKQTGFQWIVQHIPHQSFEWKAGLRQSAAFILLLQLIALLASSFIGTIPIILFIIGLIPLNFYNYGEPYQMLLASEAGPNRFLFRKITSALALYSTISLPILILFLIRHPNYWYIPVVEYVAFGTVYCYVILLKYSFYKPNQRLDSVQAFSTIGSLALIIPFFLPVIWALSIWFYFKSKAKLNYYLHDFN